MQCELPAALRPLLIGWWEEFHYAELLTLPGFLWARRGHLIAPDGPAPIVTMYGLADAAAADQPRPPEFTLMPSELDGTVTFHRRILQRISDVPMDTEPLGTAFLQLFRAASYQRDSREDAERLQQWPGVLSTSCWRSVVNAPHTSRQEVIHLTGTELIHAEVDADDAHVRQLLGRAAGELPGWDAVSYRQAFPAQPV